ncbi:ninjurin-1 isoform 2-T2 [Trichechus inunguis]
MESGAEEYELNGDVRPGFQGSPNASPLRWVGRTQPININHYANKKSAAESMLDIALLMANASQLKAVIEQGPSFTFFMPLVVLISISLVLQIGVGVLLIFLAPQGNWQKLYHPVRLGLRCHIVSLLQSSQAHSSSR